ncbi:hypothetical protein DYST_00064 [Dyella terrae]|nr:hypothetical protein DYST_00064 [Dyella terrae]
MTLGVAGRSPPVWAGLAPASYEHSDPKWTLPSTLLSQIQPSSRLNDGIKKETIQKPKLYRAQVKWSSNFLPAKFVGRDNSSVYRCFPTIVAMSHGAIQPEALWETDLGHSALP